VQHLQWFLQLLQLQDPVQQWRDASAPRQESTLERQIRHSVPGPVNINVTGVSRPLSVLYIYLDYFLFLERRRLREKAR